MTKLRFNATDPAILIDTRTRQQVLTDAFLQFNESDVRRVSKKEADASA